MHAGVHWLHGRSLSHLYTDRYLCTTSHPFTFDDLQVLPHRADATHVACPHFSPCLRPDPVQCGYCCWISFVYSLAWIYSPPHIATAHYTPTCVAAYRHLLSRNHQYILLGSLSYHPQFAEIQYISIYSTTVAHSRRMRDGKCLPRLPPGYPAVIVSTDST